MPDLVCGDGNAATYMDIGPFGTAINLLGRFNDINAAAGAPITGMRMTTDPIMRNVRFLQVTYGASKTIMHGTNTLLTTSRPVNMTLADGESIIAVGK